MDTKSPHILNTSSNLLGFSFLVLTSIKGFHVPEAGFVDESVSLCVLLFAFSCFVSFLSLHTKKEARSKIFEKIASYIFFAGILILTIIAFLLAIDVLKFSA